MKMVLLTMSSSGGKWLAKSIADTAGLKYYDKEYFNPWCNPKRELELVKEFGCEMASCYHNIARPGGAETIEKTWDVDRYEFTKEVFSAFKAKDFINAGFKVFGLVRRTDDCLPPKRSQVWTFYEHTWWALEHAAFTLTAVTARDRAREAHKIIAAKIMEDGERYGFPVLTFDDLQDASYQELYTMLARATGIASHDLAMELIETRYRERDGVRV